MTDIELGQLSESELYLLTARCCNELYERYSSLGRLQDHCISRLSEAERKLADKTQECGRMYQNYKDTNRHLMTADCTIKRLTTENSELIQSLEFAKTALENESSRIIELEHKCENLRRVIEQHNLRGLTLQPEVQVAGGGSNDEK